MRPLHITALVFAVTLAGIAGAQTSPTVGTSAGKEAPTVPTPQAIRPMRAMPLHHPMGMTRYLASLHDEVPTEPGQAAFGAIQEIVRILQADRHTDWSNVDVDALRQHLIDMDEVTMRAAARKEAIDNGLRIEISGSGRTLEAIQRMVPDHARDIDGMNGWTVRTTSMPDGVVLTVTSTNPAEVQKIRGLGFMGVMVQGSLTSHTTWSWLRGSRCTCISRWALTCV